MAELQHIEAMADGRRGYAMAEWRPGGSAIVGGRRNNARADGRHDNAMAERTLGQMGGSGMVEGRRGEAMVEG
jgi:hypothetical protein